MKRNNERKHTEDEVKADIMVEVVSWFDNGHTPTDLELMSMYKMISQKLGISVEDSVRFTEKVLDRMLDDSGDHRTLDELEREHAVDPVDLMEAEFYVIAQAFNDKPTGLVWSINADDKPKFLKEIESPSQQLIFTPMKSKLKLKRCISTMSKISGGKIQHKSWLNKYKENK